MKRKSTANIAGLPVWFWVVGLVTGILIGSFSKIDEFLDQIDQPPPNDTVTEEGPGHQSNFPSDAADLSTATEKNDAVRDPDVPFRASDGLVFEAARIDGVFVGYRIITNRDDPRMEVGDIIVSIGGSAVEDSAAGSELFIAGLSDPNNEIRLHVPGGDTR